MNSNGNAVEMRKVYQIKITIKDIKPPIWRRLQVTNDTVLEKLHVVIQVAMGWDNYHLHQFIDGNTYYMIIGYLYLTLRLIKTIAEKNSLPSLSGHGFSVRLPFLLHAAGFSSL